jgi:hypothetical protein
VNTGNKRPSPDYDDEDYENDPFAPKKVTDYSNLLCVVCILTYDIAAYGILSFRYCVGLMPCLDKQLICSL